MQQTPDFGYVKNRISQNCKIYLVYHNTMEVCKVCFRSYRGLGHIHAKRSKYNADVIALRRKHNIPVSKNI